MYTTSCRLCLLARLLMQLLAFTISIADPTAAMNSCTFINVPPRQLDCSPRTSTIKVQCVAACNPKCSSPQTSISWYWVSINNDGTRTPMQQSHFSVNNICDDTNAPTSTTSIITINLQNQSYGGYYWCEVPGPTPNNSLGSQALFVDPLCAYQKPQCFTENILTEAANVNTTRQSSFPAVGTSLCQSSSYSNSLSTLPPSYYSYSTLSSSSSIVNVPSITEGMVTHIRETLLVYPTVSPPQGDLAPPSVFQGAITASSPSLLPTTVPHIWAVSFNSTVLALVAATLSVVTMATVLLTLLVCICWRCKAKAPIREQTQVLQTPLYGLITQQNGSDCLASASAQPSGYPYTSSSGSSQAPEERDDYSTLNNPLKKGVVFQHTGPPSIIPRSKTSDYSFLQESRYQSTSLMGSQSDLRYNHVSRTASVNTLAIIATADERCNNETYGHLTFDTSDNGSEHPVVSISRAVSAMNPHTMVKTDLTDRTGAFANVSEAQHRTTYWSGYEQVGQPDVRENRKGECASQSVGCGQIGSLGYGQTGPLGCGQTGPLGYGQTGPLGCGQTGPLGCGQTGPLGYGQTGPLGGGQNGSVWYEPCELGPPTCASIVASGHNMLSEKPSTSADDVPLVEPTSPRGQESPSGQPSSIQPVPCTGAATSHKVKLNNEVLCEC